MPAIVRSEFSLALNQVATERGIDPKVVLESIEAAILAAYRKDYGTSELELEELRVELNSDNGEAHIFKDKKDITPPGFGRIAAQTAKQVILQRIREAEKQAILTDYSAKVGGIVSGMILRFDGPNVIVDIGRTQAVMPPQEQIPHERYRLNGRYTFYIEGIRETYRGNEIIVSRAHKNLVSGLFMREVPEVAQGAVEIREIAREPGSRSKVGVYSTQSGVDPVGSCVGQKGVRVQAVINELGGDEKVDIIQWSDDTAHFITSALSPAKDISVVLNQTNKTAVVTVPDDQLSLAIGREGQNVRLAAKLTGWKIDLKGKSEGQPKVAVAEGETKEPETSKVSPSTKTQAATTKPKKVKKAKTATDEAKIPSIDEAPQAEIGQAEPQQAEPSIKKTSKKDKANKDIQTNPPSVTPAETASDLKSTDEVRVAATTDTEVKKVDTQGSVDAPTLSATETSVKEVQSQDSNKTE